MSSDRHTIHCYHVAGPDPSRSDHVTMHCCACGRAIIVPREHSKDYEPERHAIASNAIKAEVGP